MAEASKKGKRKLVASQFPFAEIAIATSYDWIQADQRRGEQLTSALTRPFAGTVIVDKRTQALQYAKSEYDVLDLTNKLVFWTDASLSSRGSGIAVVWRDQHYSETWRSRNLRLIDYGNDINIAELFGITEAMKIASRMCREASAKSKITKEDHDVSTVTIYTDSQACLNLISRFSVFSTMPSGHFGRRVELARLLERAGGLAAMGVKVKLRWVPGHAGVYGNEFADRLSTQARKSMDHESLIPAKFGSSTGETLAQRLLLSTKTSPQKKQSILNTISEVRVAKTRVWERGAGRTPVSTVGARTTVRRKRATEMITGSSRGSYVGSTTTEAEQEDARESDMFKQPPSMWNRFKCLLSLN